MRICAGLQRWILFRLPIASGGRAWLCGSTASCPVTSEYDAWMRASCQVLKCCYRIVTESIGGLVCGGSTKLIDASFLFGCIRQTGLITRRLYARVVQAVLVVHAPIGTNQAQPVIKYASSAIVGAAADSARQSHAARKPTRIRS
jgi:hypothetical protein